MNWESLYQNPLKIKCLLSPLDIHLLKITLRENSKPRFLYLIKVLKIGIIIDIVQGKKPWLIEKVFIKTHSKWSAYYHLWKYIFWRSRWEQITSQDLSIWSKIWTTRTRIDGFRRTTASIIKTGWGRTVYSKPKNTFLIINYWSDQWNISQSSITIPYF